MHEGDQTGKRDGGNHDVSEVEKDAFHACTSLKTSGNMDVGKMALMPVSVQRPKNPHPSPPVDLHSTN